jgi:hypothetical protein
MQRPVFDRLLWLWYSYETESKCPGFSFASGSAEYRTGEPRRKECSSLSPNRKRKEVAMSGSVYKVIELIGTSSNSWEEAAKTAVERATKTLRDVRVAEVSELDMKIEDGKVSLYRAKVRVSFKFEN